MMLTSVATSDISVPRVSRIGHRAAHPMVPLVVIDVTVPGTSSALARRALHAALGGDLRLYIVTVDQLREHIVFRIEVTSRSVDDVIGVLSATLERATLGRAHATMIRASRPD
ncbi:hypothetical protein PQQ53_11260 [Paraburkholderia strydomiana]|jgi:hypothetical protein|uniref:hypothetical protein n=1 Tax=Paraburkholderia strydomiana TaxID=1245417 RepID=UPI0038B7E2FF